MFSSRLVAACPLFSVEQDKSIQLRIDGVPTPKARGRAVKHKNGIRVYNPNANGERTFRWTIKQLMGGLIKNNETYFQKRFVEVHLLFEFRRPTSHFTNNNREVGILKADVPRFPRVCDLDNLAKFVLDALNGLLYDDDSQVVMLTIIKQWSFNHESPGTTILRVSAVQM